MKRNLIAFGCAVLGVLVVLAVRHVWVDHEELHVIKQVIINSQRAQPVAK